MHCFYIISAILFLLIINHDVQAFTSSTRRLTSIRCTHTSYHIMHSYNKHRLPTSESIRCTHTNYIKHSYNNIQLHSTSIDTDEDVQIVVDTSGMPTIENDIIDNVKEIVIAEDAEKTYQRGLATIAFITLLFASNSPALHSAFTKVEAIPPVLLINALVTCIGLLSVVSLSPFLGKIVPDPSKSTSLSQASTSFSDFIQSPSTIAGAELGLWKTLGTTANIYGLSMTSSDHGAFLIQLTTLIVPVVQGLSGVPIPSRIWTAICFALSGVYMFTQDPTQSDCSSVNGDLLCAFAAVFYATYDLRLFKFGKEVSTDALITTKMVTQSLLSIGLLLLLGRQETFEFISQASYHDLELVAIVSLWSGLAVNCLAPFLQVSGQQAVGPARAQILYASQPLWASIMGFFFLNERFGYEGILGGTAFLSAMFLAATSEVPDPDCGVQECEV